ncbi:UNVERIFIED_CONTAM: hypothetical protein Slati_4415400 [Sesamum latifolium]|uniref:Uncharacterized protein n=1 Tax=Sesamum latifolium TaxID=2727402 RepID=A0AAW2SQV3_9LAMI
MKLGVGSHLRLGVYALVLEIASCKLIDIGTPFLFNDCSYRFREALTHLQVNRRYRRHILTGDGSSSWTHRPRYTLRLHWTMLMMTMSVTRSPLTQIKIQPSCARDCRDCSSLRTTPVLSELGTQIIPIKPPRLSYDDPCELVQST